MKVSNFYDSKWKGKQNDSLLCSTQSNRLRNWLVDPTGGARSLGAPKDKLTIEWVDNFQVLFGWEDAKVEERKMARG